MPRKKIPKTDEKFSKSKARYAYDIPGSKKKIYASDDETQFFLLKEDRTEFTEQRTGAVIIYMQGIKHERGLKSLYLESKRAMKIKDKNGEIKTSKDGKTFKKFYKDRFNLNLFIPVLEDYECDMMGRGYKKKAPNKILDKEGILTMINGVGYDLLSMVKAYKKFKNKDKPNRYETSIRKRVLFCDKFLENYKNGIYENVSNKNSVIYNKSIKNIDEYRFCLLHLGCYLSKGKIRKNGKRGNEYPVSCVTNIYALHRSVSGNVLNLSNAVRIEPDDDGNYKIAVIDCGNRTFKGVKTKGNMEIYAKRIREGLIRTVKLKYREFVSGKLDEDKSFLEEKVMILDDLNYSHYVEEFKCVVFKTRDGEYGFYTVNKSGIRTLLQKETSGINFGDYVFKTKDGDVCLCPLTVFKNRRSEALSNTDRLSLTELSKHNTYNEHMLKEFETRTVDHFGRIYKNEINEYGDNVEVRELINGNGECRNMFFMRGYDIFVRVNDANYSEQNVILFTTNFISEFNKTGGSRAIFRDDYILASKGVNKFCEPLKIKHLNKINKFSNYAVLDKVKILKDPREIDELINDIGKRYSLFNINDNTEIMQDDIVRDDASSDVYYTVEFLHEDGNYYKHRISLINEVIKEIT